MWALSSFLWVLLLPILEGTARQLQTNHRMWSDCEKRRALWPRINLDLNSDPSSKVPEAAILNNSLPLTTKMKMGGSSGANREGTKWSPSTPRRHSSLACFIVSFLRQGVIFFHSLSLLFSHPPSLIPAAYLQTVVRFPAASLV